MWALPGGFLNLDETLLDGAVRELEEETGIFDGLLGIQARLYFKKPIASQTFDDPHRSQRGRVITTAFLFQLPDGPLYPVEGRDDAAAAKWVPLNEVRVENLFDDHAAIIRTLIKQL